MNWKNVSILLAKVATVIAAAFFVSLACMNAYATSDLEFSDSKALGVGGAIFILGVIGFGLYMYNLSNPYRQNAKRRNKTEKKAAKKAALTPEEWQRKRREQNKRILAAMYDNPYSAEQYYNIPLGNEEDM
jgi:hypothetical protein